MVKTHTYKLRRGVLFQNRHTVAVTVLIYISLSDLRDATLEKRVDKEKTSIKAEKIFILLHCYAVARVF